MRLVSRRPAVMVGVSLLAAAALALGAPSGCATGAETCHFNSDCPVGYCMNGTCQQNCVDAARDCPPGYTCDQNAQCVPPGSGGTSSSGGGAGGAGTGGGAGTDGGHGRRGGARFELLVVVRRHDDRESSAQSSVASTSGTTGPSTSSSSTSGGPMNEHELDPCTSDADCASPLVCRPMSPGGVQRCTRTCSAKRRRAWPARSA